MILNENIYKNRYKPSLKWVLSKKLQRPDRQRERKTNRKTDIENYNIDYSFLHIITILKIKCLYFTKNVWIIYSMNPNFRTDKQLIEVAPVKIFSNKYWKLEEVLRFYWQFVFISMTDSVISQLQNIKNSSSLFIFKSQINAWSGPSCNCAACSQFYDLTLLIYVFICDFIILFWLI